MNLTQKGILAPVALHASRTEAALYVASAMSPADAVSTRVYRLSTQDLSGPPASIIVNHVGHVTGITQADDGALWVAGLTMQPPEGLVTPGTPPFYHARLARVEPGCSSAVQAVPLACCDAGLPVSILWTGVGPAEVPADLDDDGDVDLDDFGLFQPCVSGPGISPAPGCEDRDCDADRDVDQSDFGLFQRCFSGAGKPTNSGCAD